MSKVALYGSACNPPHLAHHAILRDLKRSGEFDEVWFMPCYQHMFGKNMVDPEHRLAMAALVAKAEGVMVCNHEIKQQKSMPTYLTLSELRQENPGFEFAVVIGGDNLKNLDQWYNWELLVTHYHLVIYERAGECLIDTADPILQMIKSASYRKISYDDPVISQLSSTQIRKWFIEKHPAVENYVHPTVLKYIQEHNLYSEEGE